MCFALLSGKKSFSWLRFIVDLIGKNSESDKAKKSGPAPPRNGLRILTYLATSVQFALALRLSNLSEASRVLSFLVLPFNRGFDPSLAFLASSAVPLGIFLYHYARGNDSPRLGGIWSIPKGGEIDTKLLVGSVIFGVGWGMSGICRQYTFQLE